MKTLLRKLYDNKPKEEDILYHYTSNEGFLGIFTNKSLRASKIQYLNDEQEFKHAFSLLENNLREKVKTSSSEIDKYVDSLVRAINAYSDTNMFIFSFSEKGDQLSQWRGYTKPGQGYSIGFKHQEIKKIIEINNKQGFLVKCIYNIAEQNELIDEFIASQTLYVNSAYEHDGGATLDFAAAPMFVQNFLYIAPVLKDPSFIEEAEWRLVSPMVNWTSKQVKFRVGKSMLIPYYEFSLAEKGYFVPFEEIVIGPTPHTELSQNSTFGFLYSKYQASDLKIRSSKIPYRDW